MRRGTALALLAALVIPFPAAGQGKPDFSGTWTLDAARSETPPGRGGRGGGGRGGGPVTIKQTATEITIGMLTYKLDGSESVNRIEGRGGMAGSEGTREIRWRQSGHRVDQRLRRHVGDEQGSPDARCGRKRNDGADD